MSAKKDKKKSKFTGLGGNAVSALIGGFLIWIIQTEIGDYKAYNAFIKQTNVEVKEAIINEFLTTFFAYTGKVYDLLNLELDADPRLIENKYDDYKGAYNKMIVYFGSEVNNELARLQAGQDVLNLFRRHLADLKKECEGYNAWENNKNRLEENEPNCPKIQTLKIMLLESRETEGRPEIKDPTIVDMKKFNKDGGVCKNPEKPKNNQYRSYVEWKCARSEVKSLTLSVADLALKEIGLREKETGN